MNNTLKLLLILSISAWASSCNIIDESKISDSFFRSSGESAFFGSLFVQHGVTTNAGGSNAGSD